MIKAGSHVSVGLAEDTQVLLTLCGSSVSTGWGGAGRGRRQVASIKRTGFVHRRLLILFLRRGWGGGALWSWKGTDVETWRTLITSMELYMMEDRLFVSYLHAPPQEALRSLFNQHTHKRFREKQTGNKNQCCWNVVLTFLSWVSLDVRVLVSVGFWRSEAWQVLKHIKGLKSESEGWICKCRDYESKIKESKAEWYPHLSGPCVQAPAPLYFPAVRSHPLLCLSEAVHPPLPPSPFTATDTRRFTYRWALL